MATNLAAILRGIRAQGNQSLIELAGGAGVGYQPREQSAVPVPVPNPGAFQVPQRGQNRMGPLADMDAGFGQAMANAGSQIGDAVIKYKQIELKEKADLYKAMGEIAGRHAEQGDPPPPRPKPPPPPERPPHDGNPADPGEKEEEATYRKAREKHKKDVEKYEAEQKRPTPPSEDVENYKAALERYEVEAAEWDRANYLRKRGRGPIKINEAKFAAEVNTWLKFTQNKDLSQIPGGMEMLKMIAATANKDYRAYELMVSAFVDAQSMFPTQQDLIAGHRSGQLQDFIKQRYNMAVSEGANIRQTARDRIYNAEVADFVYGRQRRAAPPASGGTPPIGGMIGDPGEQPAPAPAPAPATTGTPPATTGATSPASPGQVAQATNTVQTANSEDAPLTAAELNFASAVLRSGQGEVDAVKAALNRAASMGKDAKPLFDALEKQRKTMEEDNSRLALGIAVNKFRNNLDGIPKWLADNGIVLTADAQRTLDGMVNQRDQGLLGEYSKELRGIIDNLTPNVPKLLAEKGPMEGNLSRVSGAFAEYRNALRKLNSKVSKLGEKGGKLGQLISNMISQAEDTWVSYMDTTPATGGIALHTLYNPVTGDVRRVEQLTSLPKRYVDARVPPPMAWVRAVTSMDPLKRQQWNNFSKAKGRMPTTTEVIQGLVFSDRQGRPETPTVFDPEDTWGAKHINEELLQRQGVLNLADLVSRNLAILQEIGPKGIGVGGAFANMVSTVTAGVRSLIHRVTGQEVLTLSGADASHWASQGLYQSGGLFENAPNAEAIFNRAHEKNKGSWWNTSWEDSLKYNQFQNHNRQMLFQLANIHKQTGRSLSDADIELFSSMLALGSKSPEMYQAVTYALLSGSARMYETSMQQTFGLEIQVDAAGLPVRPLLRMDADQVKTIYKGMEEAFGPAAADARFMQYLNFFDERSRRHALQMWRAP